MKKTLPGSSEVKAATSPLRSRAGPAVWISGFCHLGGDDVGQESLAQTGRTGQKPRDQAVPRRRAASMNTASWSVHLLLVDEIPSPFGLSDWSSSRSGLIGRRRGSRSSARFRRVGLDPEVDPLTTEIGQVAHLTPPAGSGCAF